MAFAACGSDPAPAPPAPQSGAGGQPRYDAVQTVPVSAGEHDRFLGAAFDAGDRLVTTGYGKDTAEAKVDLIANGFTMDGALDRAFGTNGTTRVDVAGEDDRGRNLDAMVVTLASGGAVVDRKLYGVGGPNDAFLGVAVSPDGSRIAAVGYLGRETNGAAKDDGAALWLRP
jgi:hypothetical protein